MEPLSFSLSLSFFTAHSGRQESWALGSKEEFGGCVIVRENLVEKKARESETDGSEQLARVCPGKRLLFFYFFLVPILFSFGTEKESTG